MIARSTDNELGDESKRSVSNVRHFCGGIFLEGLRENISGEPDFGPEMNSQPPEYKAEALDHAVRN
jgi:hypothetical protein